MRFLAYITKGLGRVAQDEILEKVPGAETKNVSDKYIVFDTGKTPIQNVLELRTVDDIHLLLSFQDHGDKPGDNEVIQDFPLEKLQEARDTIESVRGIDNRFSLTVSRYRNSKIETDRIERELGNILENSTGGEKTDNRDSTFDVRIHVEENNTIVSCRIPERPLYYRDYWEESRKGSLKTSIAAALCRLTDPGPGDRLVDNFCGAGTILCEAALQDLEPHGGDIDRDSVQAAHTNMKNLYQEANKNIRKLDATSTDQPSDYFDLAVSNLPWGKQVELNKVELYSRAISEYARILKDDASIVLLGKEPGLAEKHLRKNFPRHRIESFQLGFLGQTPSVTYATPENRERNTAQRL
ncbi:MAG: methyltransferase domain-containing protein, partial [Candidatus Nanohaloarchaea archaeon]|nr:methyltransferase domain-containing protein [Candidatus Nanohaloarchaea archaeon]